MAITPKKPWLRKQELEQASTEAQTKTKPKSPEVIEIEDDDDVKPAAKPTTVLELQEDGSFQVVLSSQLIAIDLTGDDDDAAFAQEVASLIEVPKAQTLREIRKAQRRKNNIADDEAYARKLQAEEDALYQPKAAEDTFDVLQDYRSAINDTLQKQAAFLKITNVQANPHAQVGTPLYNRFVEAWQRVQDQTVAMVFHGTPEANVDAICKEGLDPGRRRGQVLGPGEYFAKDAAKSLAYCRGGQKMLVFAVLTDKSGLTADKIGIVVVNKPEHQLPLFVISFDKYGGGPAGMSAFGASGVTYPARSTTGILDSLVTRKPRSAAAVLNSLAARKENRARSGSAGAGVPTPYPASTGTAAHNTISASMKARMAVRAAATLSSAPIDTVAVATALFHASLARAQPAGTSALHGLGPTHGGGTVHSVGTYGRAAGLSSSARAVGHHEEGSSSSNGKDRSSGKDAGDEYS